MNLTLKEETSLKLLKIEIMKSVLNLKEGKKVKHKPKTDFTWSKDVVSKKPFRKDSPKNTVSMNAVIILYLSPDYEIKLV